MDIRAMKRTAKIAEWSERIQACRTSGLPVKKWCEQNQMCIKTYYRWEKICLSEINKQQGNPEQMAVSTGQMVRIDPEQLADAVEGGAPTTSIYSATNVGITMRYGNMSVEMPAGMDIMQIAALMKALSRQTC